jgi:hypothetical protein
VITVLILQAGVWLLDTVLGWFPDVELPDWLANLPGYASDAGEGAGAFNAWLPVALVASIGGGLMAVWAVGVSVRVFRRIVSLFTGGGGG